MPRHIIKIKDHYLLWSSVVDAPVAVCDEAQFELLGRLYFYDREPSEAELTFFNELMERVKKRGTSHKQLTNVEDFVRVNRAGPRECSLTLSEIYRAYCLGETINGWSPRPKTPS
jgi:hypothetical protein